MLDAISDDINTFTGPEGSIKLLISNLYKIIIIIIIII